MSNPPKQDWGSVAHEINVREHDRTKSEAKTERDKLLGIISEQSRQLEVALSLDWRRRHVFVYGSGAKTCAACASSARSRAGDAGLSNTGSPLARAATSRPGKPPAVT
jgi:hypothetical protein